MVQHGKSGKKQKRHQIELQAAHSRGYRDAMEAIDKNVDRFVDRLNEVVVQAEVNPSFSYDDLVNEIRDLRKAAKNIVPKSGKKNGRRNILDVIAAGSPDYSKSLVDKQLRITDDDLDVIVSRNYKERNYDY